MNKFLYPAALLFFTIHLTAQTDPVITSWVINPGGQTGYNNIPSNVQLVQYSTNNVYVSCSSIPGYVIGPWPGNPNVPVNKNFVFKITRNPQPNTGTPVNVGLGHTGVWSNGVSIFNADDGKSYQNQGVWKRNALYWEGPSFDDCLGHPAPGGEYHHHVNPRCLYDDTDSTHHSPIIGYAFDGFPVYGAYSYANTDGSGPIARMRSSYRPRPITVRTVLPNGQPAPSSGPNVSPQFPLGCFLQDFEFVPGSGDLDHHNGRLCVTPDYPGGTYAYFVTIDSALNPVFPFTMFGAYYGTVQPGNTGPMSGHNTISEPTTVYVPTTGAYEPASSITTSIWPNPTADVAYVYLEPACPNNVTGRLYNAAGMLLLELENMQPSGTYAFDLTRYGTGLYVLRLQTGTTEAVQKILKR